MQQSLFSIFDRENQMDEKTVDSIMTSFYKKLDKFPTDTIEERQLIDEIYDVFSQVKKAYRIVDGRVSRPKLKYEDIVTKQEQIFNLGHSIDTKIKEAKEKEKKEKEEKEKREKEEKEQLRLLQDREQKLRSLENKVTKKKFKEAQQIAAQQRAREILQRGRESGIVRNLPTIPEPRNNDEIKIIDEQSRQALQPQQPVVNIPVETKINASRQEQIEEMKKRLKKTILELIDIEKQPISASVRLPNQEDLDRETLLKYRQLGELAEVLKKEFKEDKEIENLEKKIGSRKIKKTTTDKRCRR